MKKKNKVNKNIELKAKGEKEGTKEKGTLSDGI
jgi:hypothetical protein